MLCQLLLGSALAAPVIVVERPGSDHDARVALARLRGGDTEALPALIAAHVRGINDATLSDQVTVVLQGRLSGEPGGLHAELTRHEDPLVGHVFPIDAYAGSEGPALLSEHRGPTIVQLWPGDCESCIASMDHLDTIASDTPRVQVVSLSVDRRRGRTRRAAEAAGFHHAWGWASPRLGRKLSPHEGPRYYVLDEDRIVRHAWTGEHTADLRLDAAVDSIMATATE